MRIFLSLCVVGFPLALSLNACSSDEEKTSAGGTGGAATGGTGASTGGASTGGAGTGGATGGTTSDASVDGAPDGRADGASVGDGAPDADGAWIPDDGATDGQVQTDCNSIFGALPGYILCSSGPTSCTFQTMTGGSNCNAVCGNLGKTCVNAKDNPNTCVMSTNANENCDSNWNDQICVCLR